MERVCEVWLERPRREIERSRQGSRGERVEGVEVERAWDRVVVGDRW